MKRNDFKLMMEGWTGALNEAHMEPLMPLGMDGRQELEGGQDMPQEMMQDMHGDMMDVMEGDMRERAKACVEMGHREGGADLMEMCRRVCGERGEMLSLCMELCMCACKCDREGCERCLREICRCERCDRVCRECCGC